MATTLHIQKKKKYIFFHISFLVTCSFHPRHISIFTKNIKIINAGSQEAIYDIHVQYIVQKGTNPHIHTLHNQRKLGWMVAALIWTGNSLYCSSPVTHTLCGFRNVQYFTQHQASWHVLLLYYGHLLLLNQIKLLHYIVFYMSSLSPVHASLMASRLLFHFWHQCNKLAG